MQNYKKTMKITLIFQPREKHHYRSAQCRPDFFSLHINVLAS